MTVALPELRIETLGGLRVTVGGTPLPGFISRKVDALLIYLACTRREHPRESLGEMLWDDLSQERTMGNLRTALSDMQKHLGAYLNVTRYSVGILPDAPVWVDLVTLNRALDNADHVLQLNESLNAPAAEALSEALTLAKGDFLRGFSIKAARGFEGWYVLEAERVRGRIIEAYGRLAEYALHKRLYKQGIDYASRTLAFDPLWEPAHRMVMTMLAYSGQRSQAIAQYETCTRLLQEELDLEPEEETTNVYERILAGELSAQAESKPTTPVIALPETPFIQRPALQARIDGLLARRDVRLISLVGPGGSGKTRLAIDAMTRHAAEAVDGIVFVKLEHAITTDEAIAAIVSALQLDANDHSLERRLIEYLYGREMLLVLDTVEQVAGIAAFIERLLVVARSLRVLVTSQERLNIKAEYAVTVSGMDVPAPDAPDAATYPAVALFAQHAERIAGDFDLAAHLPDVIALCAAVDGNPLAIELAAAWSRMMTPAQIRTEIQRSSDFLTSTAHDVPERHRSMRAVFEWSWARFSPADRKLAAQLAVFDGDFSTETAQAVTGASPPMLTALADRSLVTVSGGRCRVHGLLRDFLVEKLHEQPHLAAEARDALAVAMAEWARALLPSLAQHIANPDSIPQVIREADSLRGAWQHALEAANAAWLTPLAEVYFYFHRAMNRYTEGARLMHDAVTALGGTQTHEGARIATLAGVLYMSLAQYDTARSMLTAGIETLSAKDDAPLLRIAYDALGATAYAIGDYDAARSSFELALDLAWLMDDKRAAANALFRLGDIQSVYGDYAAAQSLLAEGLALGEDAASPHDRVRFLNLLAGVACKVGDYDSAYQSAQDALSAATVIGSRVQRGVALATLGRVEFGRGRYQESRDFLRRSVAQAEEIENRWGKAFAQAYLARTCWQLNELAAARFHLDQAQAIAQEIQTAWLMALVQRLRALPGIDRTGSPVQTLGMALHLARSIRAVPLALDALAGLASALFDAGEAEKAAHFAACVAADPLSEADARDVAQHVLDRTGTPDTTSDRAAAFDSAVALAATFMPHLA